MILAAGFGTRLRPLTDLRPKCLMPLWQKPLLDLALERLGAAGAEAVVVNTHHLAEMVHRHLAARRQEPKAIPSHEPEILGTGGGLVKARRQLGGGPFLLANADVLSDLDLARLAEIQAATGAIAVLGLYDDARFNTVALGADGRVLGFGKDAAASGAARLTYTGAACLSPRLLDYLPPRGPSSLVDALRAAIAAGHIVLGSPWRGYWNDLGTPGSLLRAHADILAAESGWLAGLKPESALDLADGARLEPGALVRGFCSLGEGAVAEAGASLENCILLPGARAGSRARLKDVILADNSSYNGEMSGGALA